LDRALDGLGVDIEKPFEVGLPLETEEQGRVEYPSVMYPVFGGCPADFSLRADGAQVIPTKHHPDTGIRDEAHFVLLAGPVFLSGGGEKIGAQFMQAHDEVSKEIRNPNMDALQEIGRCFRWRGNSG